MKCLNNFTMLLFKWRLINETIKLKGGLLLLKRFMSKKEISSCERALKHFDDFYKAVFGENWPSVRLGLLSKQKYLAVVNNFGDVETTEQFLKSQGAFDLKWFLEVQKNFVPELKDESSKSKDYVIDLGEVISQQTHLEEEKESSFHPEGLLFKSRVDSVNESNDPEEGDKLLYDPEEPTTSLDYDLKKSEIDTSRLILPDSTDGDAKLQEFIPATQLRGGDSFVCESDYYKYYKIKLDTPITIEEEHELHFPEYLKVYTFDRGDITEFPDSKKSINKVESFLKLDGGDLLAALCLGVEKNDTVLDLCSTTASISYCLFQTLRPRYLLCANADKTTRELFEEHLFDSDAWDDMLCITSENIDESENQNIFDKVLVNVPSTNDRVSLFEEEDSLFHPVNIKDRLKLPESQCEFLKNGLRLVRPGGTVVYTTSTLSPVQTDGVVSEALNLLWEESKTKFTVKDLTPALRHTASFFKYGDYLNLKYGTMVVPFTPVNFGPRYICKIVKQEQVVEETSLTSPNSELDIENNKMGN